MNKTTRRYWNLTETTIQKVVGYLIAVAIQWVGMRYYGFEVPLNQLGILGLILFVVLFVKSYAIRDLFDTAREYYYGYAKEEEEKR